MGQKRHCKGRTASGSPCPAPPITDTDWCIGHSPSEVKKALGFGGAQPGSGRPKKLRAIDVLKERMEADIDAVLKPLYDGLTANKSVVVGQGKEAHVESVPDIPTRMAAARELLDRGYGRPKQVVDAVVVTDEDLLERLAQMEGELAHIGDSGVAGDDSAVPGDEAEA